MIYYFKKLFSNFFGFFVILAIGLANYYWRFYLWLDDSAIYRFLWLGIFFILADIAIEMIEMSVRNFRLMAELMMFGKEVRKVSKGFIVIPKVKLPNNLDADYVVIGSSGIWLITTVEGDGKVTFNGEDLVRDNAVLGKLITKALEKSYALSGLLSKDFNRNLIVAPIIVFINKSADISSLPGSIRNVHIVSVKNIVKLIENTDSQILDEKIIQEISNFIKNLK